MTILNSEDSITIIIKYIINLKASISSESIKSRSVIVATISLLEKTLESMNNVIIGIQFEYFRELLISK